MTTFHYQDEAKSLKLFVSKCQNQAFCLDNQLKSLVYEANYLNRHPKSLINQAKSFIYHLICFVVEDKRLAIQVFIFNYILDLKKFG